jgi:hypothetical protein
MNQNDFILTAEILAGKQCVLYRSAHIKAGDDVKNLSHLILNLRN